MVLINIILAFIFPDILLLKKISKILRMNPKSFIQNVALKPEKIIDRVNKLTSFNKTVFTKTISKIFKSNTELPKKIATLSRMDNLSLEDRKLYAKIVSSHEHNPTKVSELLEDMTKKERKDFALTEQKISKDNIPRYLSSSWINKGKWSRISGATGELEIWLKKGNKRYVYPSVPYSVWRAMRLAKGSNGGGAGTVFWALFLRGFNRSYTGQMLKKLAKLTGIDSGLL